MSYLLEILLQLFSYSFFFVIYLLNLVVVPRLHVLSLLAPTELLLILSLLLLLKIILQWTNLIDQLCLVIIVRLCVVLHSYAYLRNVLLKFDSMFLRVFVISTGVLNICKVIINYSTLMVQWSNGCFQSFNLDFFLWDLHRHLMLLVIEHVFVICSAHWR